MFGVWRVRERGGVAVVGSGRGHMIVRAKGNGGGRSGFFNGERCGRGVYSCSMRSGSTKGRGEGQYGVRREGVHESCREGVGVAVYDGKGGSLLCNKE